MFPKFPSYLLDKLKFLDTFDDRDLEIYKNKYLHEIPRLKLRDVIRLVPTENLDSQIDLDIKVICDFLEIRNRHAVVTTPAGSFERNFEPGKTIAEKDVIKRHVWVYFKSRQPKVTFKRPTFGYHARTTQTVYTSLMIDWMGNLFKIESTVFDPPVDEMIYIRGRVKEISEYVTLNYVKIIK